MPRASMRPTALDGLRHCRATYTMNPAASRTFTSITTSVFTSSLRPRESFVDPRRHEIEYLRREGLVDGRVFGRCSCDRRLEQVIQLRQLHDTIVAIAALPERR